jgi:hypothetical protein
VTGERTVVVLPHADPTVRLRAPGHSVRDLHRAAVERLVVAALDDPAEPGQEVLRAAAAQVWRSPSDDAARLAASATLLALADPGRRWSVRLRLDDLELGEGSTERSADIRRAADGLPFGPEIAEAARIARAPGATVWVDRDQQLPALARLGSELDRPIRVAGDFAGWHWPVIAAWLPPGSQHGRLPAYWETDPQPGGQTDQGAVRWLSRPCTDDPPGSRWADEISGAQLRDPGALPPGCAAAIVGVTYADDLGIHTADGVALPWPAVRAGVRRLRAAGAQVLVEQLMGDAQRDRAGLLDTAASLAGSEVDWRIVGCRPFARSGNGTAGDSPRADGRDLRRGSGHPTVDPALPTEVARILRGRARLAPQRLAFHYLHVDRPAEPALAPGARVLRHDGQWWLADLATVRVLRLDPRIGPHLAKLPDAAAIAAAFPGRPAVTRSVLRTLGRAGVLTSARTCEPGGPP